MFARLILTVLAVAMAGPLPARSSRIDVMPLQATARPADAGPPGGAGVLAPVDLTESPAALFYEQVRVDGLRLSPSGAVGEGRFGVSVAVSGTLALVGAYADDSNRGGAYAFEFDGLTWVARGKLRANDGVAGDQFGWAVAIEGDRAIVTAPGDDGRGSAYGFVWTGAAWAQRSKIVPQGTLDGTYGLSVAMSGDRAIVGMSSDTGTIIRGTAFVYEASGTTWQQQTQLVANDGQPGDNFGFSVAMSGTLALAGAFRDDAERGAAYVFELVNGTWTQQAKLRGAEVIPGDRFGRSVALSGDRALIGADEGGVGGNAGGSAFMFERTGSTWTQRQRLVASDRPAGFADRWDERFGASVALAGDYAVVGAWSARLDPSQTSNAVERGATYVFAFDGTWRETRKITASDWAPGDRFGFAVALDGEVVFVGAWAKDATAGAVYVHEVNAPLILQALVRIEEPEASLNDTLTVVGTVRNLGDEDVLNVEVHADFTASFVFPDSVLAATLRDPVLTPIPATAPAPAVRERLEPGDTLEVRRRYLVTGIGGYRFTSGAYTEVDVSLYARVTIVTGQDAFGQSVEVTHGCDTVGPDCDTALLKKGTSLIDIRATTVDGEVATVQTGLRRYTNALFTAGIFKHLVLKDGVSQCNSGCVDLEITVRDEAGEPLEDATVKLSREIAVPADAPLKTSDGKVLLNSDGSHGFFCDLENCGQTLTLTEKTDAEGKVKGRYWLPPVISPVEATVRTEVTRADGSVASAQVELGLLPTPVELGLLTYQPDTFDIAAIRLMAGLTTITEWSDLPGWCKWGQEKLLGANPVAKIEGEYLSAAKSGIAYVCEELTSTLLDPIVRGEGVSSLDPSQKFVLIDLFNKTMQSVALLWFQQTFGISMVGTSIPKLIPTPPFLDVDSEFADAVKKAVRAVGLNLSVTGTPPLITFRLIEASYFEEHPLVDLAPQTKLFFVFQSGDAKPSVDVREVIELGYDPRLFLGQTLNTGATAQAAGAGDETVTVSGGANKSDVAVRLVVDDTTFAVGHVVLLDEGDLAERVQVIDIDGATLHLASPLKYAHAAGARLQYVDSLAVGLPDAPRVSSGPLSSMPGYTTTPVLRWWSRAPATGYAVEVATDTSFATPVLQFTDIAGDSLQLGELQDRTLYYARVAGINSFGQGAWSIPFSLYTGRPSGDDFGEAIALPADFYEGFPAWQIATTTEPNEAPGACGGGGGSIWFTFTPDRSGAYSIASFGSNHDTILSIWTGTGHPLTEISCNDNYDNQGSPVQTSYLTFEAMAGTPYYVRATAIGEPEEPLLMLTIREPTGVANETPALAEATSFAMEVWPNPAVQHATVLLHLPDAGYARLEVFDALGRRVALLHEGLLQAGIHPITMVAGGLPGGAYFVRAVVEGQPAMARRLVILR